MLVVSLGLTGQHWAASGLIYRCTHDRFQLVHLQAVYPPYSSLVKFHKVLSLDNLYFLPASLIIQKYSASGVNVPSYKHTQLCLFMKAEETEQPVKL